MESSTVVLLGSYMMLILGGAAWLHRDLLVAAAGLAEYRLGWL